MEMRERVRGREAGSVSLGVDERERETWGVDGKRERESRERERK